MPKTTSRPGSAKGAKKLQPKGGAGTRSVTVAQRIAPCLWFDSQAEEAARVLHRRFQELADHRDHALRKGGV